jgi:hypothetical protein
MRVVGVSAGTAVSSFLVVIALGACGSSSLSAGTAIAGTGGGNADGGGTTGDAGAGGSAGTTSGGGASGGDTTGGAAGSPVVRDQRIVVIIGTQVIEYRADLVAHAGQPPVLEIYASNDTEGTFRIVAVSETGGIPIVPGTTHLCRMGGTYLSLMRGGKQYDTYSESGGSCSVTVTEAGYRAGDRFAGTFSGTLIGGDSGGLEVNNGSFFGLLTL